jgi:hypothetical protein
MDNSATVADINRNMAENLRFCGPALIADETVLHNVIQMITDIITKQHPCQIEFGPEEEAFEAGEETSEFDWVVVDTGLDVVSGMAAALGQSFAELWKVFEKTILRYASSTDVPGACHCCRRPCRVHQRHGCRRDPLHFYFPQAAPAPLER